MRPSPASAATHPNPPSGPELAVMLRGVSKSYRRGGTETPVLNAVDLAVRRGECLFLLGPSGSGKTTLLSIIGCVLRPDAGALRVLGLDPLKLSARQLSQVRRDQLGFVFQRFHLIRGLTALENVCVPMTLAGQARSAAEARAHELLEQVELADHASADPRRLSVGQCQRIAIARALANNPPIILADEPTAALDAENGRKAIELLRRLTAEAGKTVIVVTHDHRILPFADRIVRVERGQLLESGLAGPPGAPALAERSASGPPPRLAAPPAPAACGAAP